MRHVTFDDLVARVEALEKDRARREEEEAASRERQTQFYIREAEHWRILAMKADLG